MLWQPVQLATPPSWKAKAGAPQNANTAAAIARIVIRLMAFMSNPPVERSGFQGRRLTARAVP
jgi:hypothetical protein